MKSLPGDDPMQEFLMAWALVILAGILESGWALGLKASHGFTRPLPSLLTVIGMAASFWLLAKAMQTLPVGTIGTVLLGIVLFQDAVNAPRLLCLGLILAGIIGLKIFSP
jgi:quaternary ammonium compound-resistance protein SugE